MAKKTIKHFLKGELTPNELSSIRRAFDVVGDIAIVEVPRGFSKKEKAIARAVLEMNRQVKTVVKKKGGHTGRYRLQKFNHLAGEKKKETITVENGVRLKVNIEKAYYSPRMGSERKRIYSQVKKGETVLVMFSGVGPYPIEIAKHSCADVYAIEMNPAAHKYSVENAMMNKAPVKLYCGDVKKVLPKLKKFDRIVMPLPKGAETYLPLAVNHIKKAGIIHYYDFLEEKDIPEAAVGKVKATCTKLKKRFRVIRTVKCGQLAPRAYRVCIDFRVL
ncbi:class I SAM-dependent methyltransferase family protein [Candidatus Woesearchaeota archaeon]|nr:class I SAM-dependent methyltransferase family protein [Candidatus Woesearchaeota archaeon]